MALKEFKNLPNTDTPINAENLNSNFNELYDNIVTLYEGDITETGNYEISEDYGNFKLLAIYGSTGVKSARNVVVVPGFKIIGNDSNYVGFNITSNPATEYYIRYSSNTGSKYIGISAIKNIHIRKIIGIK